jgi:DNA-binding GntR family transcriptional regulator
MANKQAKTVIKSRKPSASGASRHAADGAEQRRKVQGSVSVAQIVTFIRERIRAGRYVPGQRLIEADIIRELHATRSRVREALQRLATEGVITIEEFRGASVKHLTRDEVVQLYRTRMVLEGLAAAECADHASAAVKQKLDVLQRQLNDLEHSGNHEQFAKLNDEWHRLIIEGSRNHYIAAFVERLHVPVYRLLFSTFYNSGRIDSANADHQRITAAILAGKARDAEKFMREHISDALDAVNTLDSEFFN